MLNFGRLIVVIVVCLVAVPADAQTLSGGAFVDVPLGPVWDDAYTDSTRVPGATWESGLAFGFDWGRSGVEFDVGVPQWHVKNLGPQRYQYVGPSFGWEQQGHFYESSSTERRRSIDVTVLHRSSVPVNRHVTFTWLVGGGFVYRPEQFTSVTKEVLPDGQLTEVNTNTSTSLRNYLAATARLDVEFRVAPHVSVVPRLRVTAFPSLLDDSGLAPRMLMGRPEIAVRWGF
jgi:hypothetical protein